MKTWIFRHASSVIESDLTGCLKLRNYWSIIVRVIYADGLCSYLYVFYMLNIFLRRTPIGYSEKIACGIVVKHSFVSKLNNMQIGKIERYESKRYFVRCWTGSCPTVLISSVLKIQTDVEKTLLRLPHTCFCTFCWQRQLTRLFFSFCMTWEFYNPNI